MSTTSLYSDYPALCTSSLSHYPFFFFNDTATTEIYTLSLHDALPIFRHARLPSRRVQDGRAQRPCAGGARGATGDRKSTRLNSSHVRISYAVFCLKKKKNKKRQQIRQITISRQKRAEQSISMLQ